MDCLVLRARLKHVRAVLTAPSQLANAVLAANTASPWTALALQDMRTIKRRLPGKFASLGDPAEDADGWRGLIAEHPSEWKALVNMLAFPDSLADPSKAKGTYPLENRPADLGGRHPCVECAFTCPSARALATHARLMHGRPTGVSHWVGQDAKCLVC